MKLFIPVPNRENKLKNQESNRWLGRSFENSAITHAKLFAKHELLEFSLSSSYSTRLNSLPVNPARSWTPGSAWGF